MYSLDINFLKDRSQRPSEAGLGGAARPVRENPRPLYIGGAVAIALLGLVGGAWFILQSQTQALQQQQADLDNKLEQLKIQQGQVTKINSDISQIEGENQALATVFDQIKPWSAVLQDVRDRVPSGVQISEIEQFVPVAPTPAAAPNPSPSPGASPTPGNPPAAAAEPETPTPGIRITGMTRSFSDVNDFLLTLQRSPFLDGEKVKIVSTKLIDNPTQVEFADQSSSGGIQVKLPQVVQYTIEGSLTNLTASELLQDLERTLSVGLAARIQALRDRGVLKP